MSNTGTAFAHIPRLYSQNVEDPVDIVIHEKFYLRNVTWYIAEYDPANEMCYGYALKHSDLDRSQWAYIKVYDLCSVYAYGAKFDRDIHFKTQRFGDIEEIRQVLGHSIILQYI